MLLKRSSPMQRESFEPRQVRKEATVESQSRVTWGSLTSFC